MASCQHKLPQNAEADHRDITPDKAVRRVGSSRFILGASRKRTKNHEIDGGSALVVLRPGFVVLPGSYETESLELRGFARIREGLKVVPISTIRRPKQK